MENDKKLTKPVSNILKSVDTNWKQEFIDKLVSQNIHEYPPPNISHSFNLLSKQGKAVNTIISTQEIINTNQTKHTLPGIDGLLHGLLKHLPTIALETLINIFNYIILTDNVPENW